MARITGSTANRYAPAMFGATIVLLMSLPTPETVRALPASDKIQHAGAFGVLGVLIAMAVQRPALPLKRTHALLAVVVTMAFGALTEINQYYLVSSRAGSIQDVYADFIGAMPAVSAYYMVAGKYPRISLILGS